MIAETEPSASPRTGVVIVNYNSAEHLAACLESLRAEPYAEVLVWDNASDDVDAAVLSELTAGYPRVALKISPENIGFGAAVNRAISRLRESARVDYVWVLNPDVVVRAGALSTLVSGAYRQGCDITSPLIVSGRRSGDEFTIWYAGGELFPRSGRSVHTRIGKPIDPADVGFRRVSFISGAAPLIRLDAWDKLGGFDEALFLYCEDADLSLRAAKLGLSLGVQLDAVVSHWEGASSGAAGPGPTFYYYVQRNRFHVYGRSASRLQLLLGRGALETVRLLVLPFRPLSNQSLRSFVSSIHGLVAGLTGEVGPRSDNRPSAGSRLRIYDEARTTHLERLPDDGSVSFVYRKARYDFDRSLAEAKGARQLGRLGAALEILRRRPHSLELNEPAYVGAWPATALYLAAARVLRWTSSHGPDVVAYAIENGDPIGAVSAKYRLPKWLATGIVRSVIAVLVRGYTRMAFGTSGARDVYQSLLGERALGRVAHRVVPSLEEPCRCGRSVSTEFGRVLFLGSFESRKGLPQLLAAWPLAVAEEASLQLRIVGKGPLAEQTEQWARDRLETTVVVDPERAAIHAELALASVLVLLSQPTPTWREQIGLPILEALSHGCTVIASSETGLARWLSDNGHTVLAPDVSLVDFASAIADRAINPLASAAVLSSLPVDGGRAQADEWLTDAMGSVL